MSEPFHLFERFGVELEYMIVDRESLRVLPLADRIIHTVTGAYESEVEMGPLSWSNELVLHVIELKTNGPVVALNVLADRFQADVARINAILAPWGAMLMPSAMHPWMDPDTDTVLWPHEHSPVYEAFDRIFNCKGHGWSNLQCTHLNLPFANDEEFGRLHTAIRLILPILPALAASSPLVDGRLTGFMDTRLHVYRNNARRVPSVSGRVIPELVFSHADYDREILQRIYRDLAPLDPEGILRDEWVNARGAIARFERNTIEIRVLDIQECPVADLAIVSLIVEVVRGLVEERWCGHEEQRRWAVDRLEPIFSATVEHAEEAVIDDRDYLRALGADETASCAAGDLWRHLHGLVRGGLSTEFQEPLREILEKGCLARRIVRAAGESQDRLRMEAAYRELSLCLSEGRMFHA